MSDEITVIRVVIPDAKIVRINVSSLSSGGTSFVADVPLVLAGGHLSIPKSDAVTDGYLDNADWTTFNGKLNPVFFNPGGRLTTESGVPVSTSDRTSQGTLYYTPYKHNNIYTYSGSAWQAKTFSEISLSLSVTSGKNYDVFINSGATTLSLSAAWSDDVTRTDALGTQDGVTVLSSDHTKLWLGTIRASGSNITEDSLSARYVWNFYNSVPRSLMRVELATSHSYAVAAYREWNGGTGGPHAVSFVTGQVQSVGASGWAMLQGGGLGSGAVGIVAFTLNSTSTEGEARTASEVNTSNAIYGLAGYYQSVAGLNTMYVVEYALGGSENFNYYRLCVQITC